VGVVTDNKKNKFEALFSNILPHKQSHSKQREPPIICHYLTE